MIGVLWFGRLIYNSKIDSIPKGLVLPELQVLEALSVRFILE